MPKEPKATGDVLASKARLAAYSGEKPMPISRAAQMATGVPNPAAPSKNVPKQKAIKRACIRRSGEIAATLPFDDLELPGANRQVEQEDRRQDDPADGHQAKAGAVGGGRQRRRSRHPEHADSNGQGGRQSGKGGAWGRGAADQKPQQYEDRQAGHERR